MDAKEIKEYREAYYKELCEQSKGGTWNLPRETLEQQFKHLAFEKPDSYIEELAAYYTPAEAAHEELQ